MKYELRSAEILTDLLSDRLVVRIQYRERLTRPWIAFYLEPDEGESIQSVAAKIWPAIAAHAEKRAARE